MEWKLISPFLFVVSQNSVCVTTKLAQITVERENGCLGLTLRGGGDFPLIVTNVRPHGPVFKVNRIKPGDRLLRVDNVSVTNSTVFCFELGLFSHFIFILFTDFPYKQITFGGAANFKVRSCRGPNKFDD